jgi:hypothetical protein
VLQASIILGTVTAMGQGGKERCWQFQQSVAGIPVALKSMPYQA